MSSQLSERLLSLSLCTPRISEKSEKSIAIYPSVAVSVFD